MTRQHPLHILQHDVYTAKIYPPDNLGYGVYVYREESPLCGFWRQTEKQALEDARKDLERWAHMKTGYSDESFSVTQLRSLYDQFNKDQNTKRNYGDNVGGFLNWLETIR